MAIAVQSEMNSLGDDLLWVEKFKDLKEFMNANGRRPHRFAENPEESYLSKWEAYQLKKFKNFDEHSESFGEIPTDHFHAWYEWVHEGKFKDLYLSNEEVWFSLLEETKTFLREFGRRPSDVNGLDEFRLADWLKKQRQPSRERKELMRNEKVFEAWENFFSEFSIFLK